MPLHLVNVAKPVAAENDATLLPVLKNTSARQMQFLRPFEKTDDGRDFLVRRGLAVIVAYNKLCDRRANCAPTAYGLTARTRTTTRVSIAGTFAGSATHTGASMDDSGEMTSGYASTSLPKLASPIIVPSPSAA